MDFSFVITSFVTIFVVVDAPSAATIFLSLTRGMDKKRVRVIALRACMTSIVILTLFIFFGANILKFFSITVGAFQMAGGVILFIIGFSMISVIRPRAISTPEEEADSSEKEDISIVPMAIPILSGPASITTVMVLTSQMDAWEGKLVVLGCCVLVMIIAFFLFIGAGVIHRIMGNTGLKVVERIMGLILCVVAMQFFIDGTKKAFF